MKIKVAMRYYGLPIRLAGSTMEITINAMGEGGEEHSHQLLMRVVIVVFLENSLKTSIKNKNTISFTQLSSSWESIPGNKSHSL